MTMTPFTFYLVRESVTYGKGYNLSTYVPKASTSGLCWSFWPDDPKDFNIHQDSEEASRIERKLGFKVEPGTCVNLTTGEVTLLKDAEQIR
jgi:hypothetical protein